MYSNKCGTDKDDVVFGNMVLYNMGRYCMVYVKYG